MQAIPKNRMPRKYGLSARIHISTVSTAPTSGKYSGNTSGRYHFSFTAVSQSPYRAPTKYPLSAHKVPTPRPRSWRAPTKYPPRDWRKINEKSKAPTKYPPRDLVRGERPQSTHPETGGKSTKNRKRPQSTHPETSFVASAHKVPTPKTKSSDLSTTQPAQTRPGRT